MENITLHSISKTGNSIIYDFSVSPGLAAFFSGKPLQVHYPFDISCVPNAIAAVPFVSCILPVIWLNDATLVLPELDKDFFECLENVKKGYAAMFPESSFAGRFEIGHIVPYERPSTGRCAMLFSGGLDATQTLVSHLEEKPELLSIWGSDIRYDNEQGWHNVHQGICEISSRFGLKNAVIRSSFREFDNESVLDRHFSAQLKDTWWHGVKHALALLGHVAPYAYINGIDRVYIASSNCPADGVVRCASHPSTDSHVRYNACQVIHDGFEFSRQDKAHNVVDFCRRTGKVVTLHACWQSQSGSNCCHCEKCYRTMAALMAEGADPLDFGFALSTKTLPDMQRYVVRCKELNPNTAKSYWKHIHDRILENQASLKKLPTWKYMKWIAKADFLHRDQLTLPLGYRIERRIAFSRFGPLWCKLWYRA